jgi:TrmH family RNA methyltransferase
VDTLAGLVLTFDASGRSFAALQFDGERALAEVDGALHQPHSLSELARLADARVRIPMRGRAESLNLAAAAAICLYATQLAQA